MKNRSEAAALAKHISAFLGDYVLHKKAGAPTRLRHTRILLVYTCSSLSREG